MCLAVPAQVVALDGADAQVDLQGSKLSISTVLTPDVGLGDWVLVHAGFAIAQLDAAEAQETWDYLRQLDDPEETVPATVPPAPSQPGGTAR